MSDEQAEGATVALSVDPQAEEAQQPTEETQTPTTSSPSNGTSLGGRVRRTTQKFTIVEPKSDDTEDFTPPVGKGTKLRDIPFVRSNVEALGKKQEEMIRQLYSVLFGRRYQKKNMKVIKEQLLEFSGIPEQDEKSREHLEAKIGKWKVVFVHEVMDLLAVDRSKKSFDDEGKPQDKESLIGRLIEWLYDPKKTTVADKKMAAAERAERAEKDKARRKTQVAKTKEKAAKKAGAKKPATKKRKTNKKVVAEDDDEEGSEETESEAEESSSDFEESTKASKKRRKVTPRSKKKAIEESEGEDEGDDAKDEIDVSAAGSEKGAEASKDAEPKEDSKEDDGKAEPLPADVCDKVRDIIANGNAEELTVKKIVRQLSADLGRDMSTQKKAIKEFITGDQMEC
ncbi:hypothetical protein PHYBOEH_011111 [Phytophthora boehmeriae]|uniref:DEK-C domain-containing protein n=1 Tax=Phytophthora boehmeriae TaxID=109152 RepID=A0A8T1VJZ0_9STRA|nr:hypothetical protein PHYBOEH_011111 [Phytophthora boehmeriae]